MPFDTPDAEMRWLTLKLGQEQEQVRRARRLARNAQTALALAEGRVSELERRIKALNGGPR